MNDHDNTPQDAVNYANAEAETALAALQGTPDYAHLAAFLNALRDEYLVVDVTGSAHTSGTKKHRRGRSAGATRIRTLRSTTGQLVLPLFTSMAELRLAASGNPDETRGAIMPAREAIALIESDRFVAAEVNPASAKLVMLRKYLKLALGDDEITAESLEAMRG